MRLRSRVGSYLVQILNSCSCWVFLIRLSVIEYYVSSWTIIWQCLDISDLPTFLVLTWAICVFVFWNISCNLLRSSFILFNVSGFGANLDGGYCVHSIIGRNEACQVRQWDHAYKAFPWRVQACPPCSRYVLCFALLSPTSELWSQSWLFFFFFWRDCFLVNKHAKLTHTCHNSEFTDVMFSNELVCVTWFLQEFN